MTVVSWINGCSCFNAMHQTALDGLDTDVGRFHRGIESWR